MHMLETECHRPFLDHIIPENRCWIRNGFGLWGKVGLTALSCASVGDGGNLLRLSPELKTRGVGGFVVLPSLLLVSSTTLSPSILTGPSGSCWRFWL